MTQHVVLGIKGFFRRANLIPNSWKLRIGATHELYTKEIDNNVQIQGLTGRMTGYWREQIEKGHKTGPHRTSIKAIIQYEKTYLDPFGINSYQTSGFRKKDGQVSAQSTMLSAKNIANLEAVDLPDIKTNVPKTEIDKKLYRVYLNQETAKAVCKMLYNVFYEHMENAEGFFVTSNPHYRTKISGAITLKDAIQLVPKSY